MLLLGDGGENRQHGIAEDARTVQVLLSERFEGHAVAGELLQVLQRLQHTLAAEAVERPELHHIELATVGSVENGLKLLTVSVFAAGFVDVLGSDVPKGVRIGMLN
jgi:hypothetical protein